MSPIPPITSNSGATLAPPESPDEKVSLVAARQLSLSTEDQTLNRELERRYEIFQTDSSQAARNQLFEQAQSICNRAAWFLLKPYRKALAPLRNPQGETLLEWATKTNQQTAKELQAIFGTQVEAAEQKVMANYCAREREQPEELAELFRIVREDTLPQGTALLSPIRVTDQNRELILSMARGEDLEGKDLAKLMAGREMAGFQAVLAKALQHSEDPSLFLRMQRQFPLPAHLTIRSQTQSIETLAKDARAAALEARKKANRLKGRERLQALLECNRLDQKAEDLEKRAEESKTKETKLSKNWDKQLRSYYESFPQPFFCELETLQLEPLVVQCEELSSMQPQSIMPFLPWLTTHSYLLDDENLAEFIVQAKKCDLYLTYGAVFQFWLMSISILELKPKASRVFKALHQAYPEDIVLGPFIKALDSKEEELEVDEERVKSAVETAFNQLAEGKIDEAIHQLSQTKPLLMGFSLIHRCLAFAWALKGDSERAMSLEKRASQLPFIFETSRIIVSSELFDKTWAMLDTIRSKKVKVPKTGKTPPFRPSWAKTFIEQTKHPERVDYDSICAFLNECIKIETAEDPEKGLIITKAEVQNFVPLYLGLRWFSSHMVLSQGRQEAYKTLSRAIGVLAGEVTTPNDWFSEHFERHQEGDCAHFSVSCQVPFGLEPDPLPKIQFQGGLRVLTPESRNSLALCVTKQLYDLWIGMLIATVPTRVESLAEALDEIKEVLPSKNPQVFFGLLRLGFNTGIPRNATESALSQRAICSLEHYLKNPLFPVKESTLEWMKFCTFSQDPCESPSGSLHAEVRGIYYPPGYKLQATDNPLALRDVLLASHRIEMRSAPDPTFELSRETMYAVFEFSQHLFGWRLNETFEEWGARLKKEQKEGIFAPGYTLNPVRSSSNTEFKLATLKALPILRHILEFWIEFYEKTAAKNAFIQADGNEDLPGNSERPWHQNVAPQQWKQMIQTNTPKTYPGYAALSKKDQTALSQVVKSKHEHDQELKTLKKSAYTSEVPAALSLLSNAEQQRQEVSHSIFVKTKEVAERTYRILLEVAIDRKIRHLLVQSGPTQWKILETQEAVQLLRPLFETLSGSFHGPEEHLSGMGPLQRHFNAAAVPPSTALVNTHIYFD